MWLIFHPKIPNELNIGKTRSRTTNNKIEQLVQDESTVLTIALNLIKSFHYILLFLSVIYKRLSIGVTFSYLIFVSTDLP